MLDFFTPSFLSGSSFVEEKAEGVVVVPLVGEPEDHPGFDLISNLPM